MSEILESEHFAYNAPQFCNLSTANGDDDPQVEEYFNYNHEHVPQYEDISSDDDTKLAFYTPLKLDTIEPPLRKSLSMGNLLLPIKTIAGPRQMSRDRLNMLAQPKSRLTQASFISSAELITKFHHTTPKRFRTTSAHSNVKPLQSQLGDVFGEKRGPLTALVRGMGLTMPQSPALATRSRSRPTMYMSKDVREEQELQDMKKLQIKANPIPKTNYGPAVPLKIDKKPTTVIQAFKLTEMSVKKELVVPETPGVEFHAKPMPKKFLQKDIQDTKSKPLKAIHTKPAPFSFQTKQDEMLKKREQLLSKIMEEEKKNREFHAKPIPKSVYKSPMKNSLNRAKSKENIGPSSNGSAKSSNTNLSNTTLFGNNMNGDEGAFKAKPANVLKRPPFIPKLNLLPLTAISAFNLNTDRRIAAREAYMLKIKEKDETIAKLDEARLIREGLKEKADLALLRKQMDVKANPIRQFKPVLPIAPKPVTIPQTPKLSQMNKNPCKFI